MEHPFSNEVLDKILEYFDDDFPSENMDDDDWEEILQKQFNTFEEHFDYSDYMRDYPTILEVIHTREEDWGIEPTYWNCQKIISLYMYIVAIEIIANCKEHIIATFFERHGTQEVLIEPTQ